MDNGMIGKYVIVRCRDAGVHAGVLASHEGRECILTESRRLWYWKPKDGARYLSGVANHGLDDASKIGEPLIRLHLTENCEIIQCTEAAELSIRRIKNGNGGSDDSGFGFGFGDGFGYGDGGVCGDGAG